MHAHRAIRLVPLLLSACLLALPVSGAQAVPAGVGAAAASKHATKHAKKKSTKKKTTKHSHSGKSSTLPSISKVRPLKLGIGDRLTVSGKRFRPGKSKNTVVLKRDGKKAIFVRVTAKATSTRLQITVPAKLLPYLRLKGNAPVPTRFRVRILAKRFGLHYTSTKASPLIAPSAAGVGGAAAAGATGDCDGDGIQNSKDADDDNDLVPDTVETAIGTSTCNADTDGDGMSDGWEYQSAVDRNGGTVPSFQGKRSYPNPLDPTDGAIDSDGDGLTNVQEYAAWATYGNHAFPLSYSGGNPASAGRGPVPPGQAYMDRDHNGFLSDWERDADGDGIPNMDEGGNKDEARLTTGQPDSDLNYHDYGVFTSAYVDLASKQSAEPQLLCAGINQVPYYCTDALQPTPIETQKIDSLDWLSADSDGDGIRDDVDDSDHDGVGNLAEYLQEIGQRPSQRHYAPINPCYPNADARLCLIGNQDIDGDGISNRDDTDDDGDGLSDDLERQLGTDPLRADTDGDGVTDGFEYYSALDLNSAALPYPGKRPYPNPLDKADGTTDFDGDGLTMADEFKAWSYQGRPWPLTYSDGTQDTGGTGLTDDRKDVDGDGLSNWDELYGGMNPDWWKAQYNGTDPLTRPLESVYPDRAYTATDFVDPDTDGDGILDGADDEDHDGFSNATEVHRAANWYLVYVSTTHTGSDPSARVNPFNPCKPLYSSACHLHPPQGYYPPTEDWQGPPGNGP
jgi:hypothetical protein